MASGRRSGDPKDLILVDPSRPELGFTDEQVEAEVAKLDPDDKKFYEEYRGFLDTYYCQHGKIIEMPDLIKLIMMGRYPEIPSTTKKEQDKLWDKLLIETRKREMSQQARLEEEPPRKIRRIVPERKWGRSLMLREMTIWMPQ